MMWKDKYIGWIVVAGTLVAVLVYWLLTNRRIKKPVWTMRTSKEGLDIIKQHEGWSATAYADPVGLMTIGYGHLIKEGEDHLLSATLTLEQGEELLKADVAWAERAVLSYVHVSINQDQFDALVSFVFNVGAENFRKSTLLKQINAGATEAEIRYEFSRWNKAKGQVLAGLTTRRQSEADLYFTA